MLIKKYDLHLGSAESPKPKSSQRRASPTRLRRSGSLNLDPDIFKSTNFSDLDVGKKSLAKTVLLNFTKLFKWKRIQPDMNQICTSVFLASFSQWHPKDACSQGTPVLSGHFPSPRTPPHLAPFCCPPIHWLHSQEACSLRHCPVVMLTHPSLCPTPGPTKERAVLTSKTPAPGEKQQAQQRVI